MLGQPFTLSFVNWEQKRALVREILGENELVREATPDLSEDQLYFEQKKLKEAANLGQDEMSQVLLETFTHQNISLSLWGSSSSKLQVGPEANRARIALGFELLMELSLDPQKTSWAEWNAGYGNLSAAFASFLGDPLWVFEADKRNRELLGKNNKYYATTTLWDPTQGIPDSEGLKLLLASSLKEPSTWGPQLLRAERVLLYTSNLQLLIRDQEALREHYALEKWSLADLFSGTPHAEAVTLWHRKNVY